jgi:hypothetical protein
MTAYVFFMIFCSLIGVAVGGIAAPGHHHLIAGIADHTVGIGLRAVVGGALRRTRGGKAAAAPILPKPKTALPSVTTAIVRPLIVCVRANSWSEAIARQTATSFDLNFKEIFISNNFIRSFSFSDVHLPFVTDVTGDCTPNKNKDKSQVKNQ